MNVLAMVLSPVVYSVLMNLLTFHVPGGHRKYELNIYLNVPDGHKKYELNIYFQNASKACKLTA